jgi:hypothetical protein
LLLLACLLAGGVCLLPPIRERLAARLDEWRMRQWRSNAPRETVVFVPRQQTLEIPAAQGMPVAATSTLSLPGFTPTAAQQPALATALPSLTPTSTATPTLAPTLLPAKVTLTGIRHEYQSFNNCGPANLAMLLSFWGWSGDQTITRAYLRPNLDADDKNVMPAEMIRFVETQTQLRAVSRVGGAVETLKQFIAAGFPVLIEKGHHPPDDWWMGHFLVVNGYDDERQTLITQDSLIQADFPLPYADLLAEWRSFNNVYIVVYPPESEGVVFSILGPNADLDFNFHQAAQNAQAEIGVLTGRDQLFAWYNLGTNLVALGEFAEAATAYDKAFAINHSLPDKDRLYRMLWYQVGPYEAYYRVGRYQDVIDLGNATLAWIGQPVLEETFYWLGLAREATGDLEKAIYDFKKAAELSPNATPALKELERLGVAFP